MKEPEMKNDELLRIIETAAEEEWEELDLSNRGISSLPPLIGSLAKLARLDINSNQLSYLPPEIGNLCNLIELYLTNNRLRTLPSEIGKMAFLSKLGSG